jgi:hypothetical protein
MPKMLKGSRPGLSTSSSPSDTISRSISQSTGRRSEFITPECLDSVQIATVLDTTRRTAIGPRPIGWASSSVSSTRASTRMKSLAIGSKLSKTKTARKDVGAKDLKMAEGVDLLSQNKDTTPIVDNMMEDKTNPKGVDPQGIENSKRDKVTTPETMDGMREGVDLLIIRHPPEDQLTGKIKGVDPLLSLQPPDLQPPGKIPTRLHPKPIRKTLEPKLTKDARKARQTKETSEARSTIDDQRAKQRPQSNRTREAEAKTMTTTRDVIAREPSPPPAVATRPDVVYWNCSHSLSSKMDFVRQFLNDRKPQLMFIAECELSRHDEINLNFFYVADYSLYHSNTREKRGNLKLKSRICVYIRNDVEFKRHEGLEGLNEMIVLDLKHWRVIGTYRPFKLLMGETLRSNFDRLVESLRGASQKQGLNVICVGDMNVDWINDSPFKNTLMSWAYDADLVQIINTITRARSVRTKKGDRAESSTLDHVYVPSILSNDVKIFQQSSHLSDHDIIIIEIPGPSPRQSIKNTKVVLRDWRKYNPHKLQEALDVRLGEHVMSGSESIDSTIVQLNLAFEELVPLRVARFKPENGEIPNAKIAKVRKRRDRHYKLFIKTGLEFYLHQSKKDTKSLKKIIKKEKKRVIQTKLKSPNPKTFWTVINNMLGKRRFDHEWSMKSMNGEIIKDSTIIAENFVDFFTNKVLKLAHTLPGNPAWDSEGADVEFTTEDLEKAVKKTKSKHCYGPSGVPLRIVRDFCIVKPGQALDLMNSIAKHGLSLNQKTARIIPLHKKGNKDDFSNYRPIANLCSVGKIFEKLLLHKLLVETEGLEGLYQHGFRSSHSTTTALLQLQDRISKSLDDAKPCLVYSVDLSAAFDVLRPDVFMEAMRDVLSHGLAKSLCDFLKDRRIICEVEGKRSTPRNLPIGCVQGSILGPRIFALYMGKLAESIEHDDVVGFADDTYVIITGNTTEELVSKTEQISKKHVQFLQSIGMVVNPSKTEAVIFGSKENGIEINFAGTPIRTTATMKALGVLLESNLKWDAHLKNVVSKSQTKLSLVRKIRPYITCPQFLQIATCQIFSTLYYASPVWLNHTLSYHLQKRIDSFHYRVMRVAVNDFKGRRKRKDIDQQCKRATPRMWSSYITASLAMKILRDDKPKLLADSIRTSMTVERRRPRNGRFFDTSRRRAGRQRFCNRLKHLNDIDVPWLYPTPTNDSIRVLLKKHFNFDFIL